MADVLDSGPDRAGVKVAVMDSGLEICHPDLRDNMESGASFNFNASLAEFELELAWATRLDVSDPFNYDATGGHGTGVAGLIAAAADNGIGGRGVAPSVQLRGYNGLQASSQFSALIDSLGVSTFYPNSTDVHIFNMSFGSSGSQPENVDPYFERVFTYGVNHLRSGLGAIYVKSAGNAFRRCNSLVRDLNASLGCGSANGNDWNNLPYLIVVGAFNADGRKASYASAGANIWVSAPGGESGSSKPALLTTDQMGWDRGYGVLRSNNPLDDRTTVNRYGDYTGRMNGTSAAAAIVSGAVDLDAAVEMAEDFTPDSLGDFRQTGWFEQATPIAVPDNNGTGAAQTLNVSGLPDDASIEAVILEIDISHEFPNDLGIHLVSPGGTRSVVNQVFNETLAVSDIDRIRWRLLSNAFYGEGPNGDWQINVFDAADEDTGDLDAWRLRIFYGAHPEEEDGDATEGSDGTGDSDDAGDGG